MTGSLHDTCDGSGHNPEATPLPTSLWRRSARGAGGSYLLHVAGLVHQKQQWASRRPELCTPGMVLDDPAIPVDANLLDNAIRSFVIEA
jgi:hypothetical protein